MATSHNMLMISSWLSAR